MPDLQTDPLASSPPAGPSASQSPASDPSHALEHLAKMSGTGSAFGQAEYVAVNGMSIAAAVLGVASGLTLIASLFLFLPLLGVVFGVVAFRQIRNSNGTQTGIIFAICGIVLSLALGGGVLVNMQREAAKTREDTKLCAEAISNFGEQVKAITARGSDPEALAADYDRLYNSAMTESFRTRFDAKKFRTTLAAIFGKTKDGKGGLEYMKWNGGPVGFDPLPESDSKLGMMKVLMKLNGQREGQEDIHITDREGAGVWKIDGMRGLFPEQKLTEQ